jgi:hypothetical protein
LINRARKNEEEKSWCSLNTLLQPTVMQSDVEKNSPKRNFALCSNILIFSKSQYLWKVKPKYQQSDSKVRATTKTAAVTFGKKFPFLVFIKNIKNLS